MRTLVTGAGGFVGRNLAERLLIDGHDVHLFVRPGRDSWRTSDLGGKHHDVDIADARAVDAAWRRIAPEWVFHCAAHGAYSFQRDTVEMARTNVVGMSALLSAAARHGCQAFVNSGSSSEYGDVDHAPDEDEAPRPNSSYAATKAAATWLCARAAAEHAVPVRTLRLYSVYGPWEDPRRLIPALCMHGLEHRLPPLASPWVVRDFVFVVDVVDAYVKAANAPVGAGSVFNIGSGLQTTLEELADVASGVFAIAEQPVWDSYGTRDWDTRAWVSDPSRARGQLSWEATTPLGVGLRLTAEWFEKNRDRIAAVLNDLSTAV